MSKFDVQVQTTKVVLFNGEVITEQEVRALRDKLNGVLDDFTVSRTETLLAEHLWLHELVEKYGISSL